MSSLPIDSFERMPPAELLGLVRNLIAEVGRLRAENEKLSEALAMQRVENQALKDEIARLKHLPPRPPLKPSGMDKATDRPEVWAEGKKGKAEVGRLRAENEKLSEALAMQRVENQALKDEIARLKHLPPRPPLKPSGMDKATDRPEVWAEGKKGKASKRRRGPGVSKLSIDRTVTLTVKPAAGARHKGYEEIVVQDLMLRAETTLLSARALADAGRRHADRAPRYGDRRRLRPPSAPARADAPFSGPDAVRTHRGAAGRAWLGHLQAAGGSAPDRQTGPVPRRGRGRVAGGAHRRAVRHRRRHRGAPRWQGLLHHPHRRRPVRGLPHRAGQIAPGFLEPSARRGGALCHQRRRPRLHARGQSAAGRHRQARRPCLASFRLARGMDGPLARARPDGSQGHARSRARGQRSGALGRDRSRGPARRRGHRLRRRRPVRRRRARPLLGSRRAAHPQAHSRQRQAAQRRRGRQADGLVVLSPTQRLQTRPEPHAGRGAERPLRPHLQAPLRLRHPRSSVETPARAQARTLARAQPAGHPAQHQRLRKRHPRLRHQTQNLRWNRQRQRSPGARRHARPGQNLQKTQNPVLRLSRRPPRHSRPPHPKPRNPRQPGAHLSQAPGNLPRLHTLGSGRLPRRIAISRTAARDALRLAKCYARSTYQAFTTSFAHPRNLANCLSFAAWLWNSTAKRGYEKAPPLSAVLGGEGPPQRAIQGATEVDNSTVLFSLKAFVAVLSLAHDMSGLGSARSVR